MQRTIERGAKMIDIFGLAEENLGIMVWEDGMSIHDGDRAVELGNLSFLGGDKKEEAIKAIIRVLEKRPEYVSRFPLKIIANTIVGIHETRRDIFNIINDFLKDALEDERTSIATSHIFIRNLVALLNIGRKPVDLIRECVAYDDISYVSSDNPYIVIHSRHVGPSFDSYSIAAARIKALVNNDASLQRVPGFRCTDPVRMSFTVCCENFVTHLEENDNVLHLVERGMKSGRISKLAALQIVKDYPVLFHLALEHDYLDEEAITAILVDNIKKFDVSTLGHENALSVLKKNPGMIQFIENPTEDHLRTACTAENGFMVPYLTDVEIRPVWASESLERIMCEEPDVSTKDKDELFRFWRIAGGLKLLYKMNPDNRSVRMVMEHITDSRELSEINARMSRTDLKKGTVYSCSYFPHLLKEIYLRPEIFMLSEQMSSLMPTTRYDLTKLINFDKHMEHFNISINYNLIGRLQTVDPAALPVMYGLHPEVGKYVERLPRSPLVFGLSADVLNDLGFREALSSVEEIGMDCSYFMHNEISHVLYRLYGGDSHVWEKLVEGDHYKIFHAPVITDRMIEIATSSDDPTVLEFVRKYRERITVSL